MQHLLNKKSLIVMLLTKKCHCHHPRAYAKYQNDLQQIQFASVTRALRLCASSDKPTVCKRLFPVVLQPGFAPAPGLQISQARPHLEQALRNETTSAGQAFRGSPLTGEIAVIKYDTSWPRLRLSHHALVETKAMDK